MSRTTKPSSADAPGARLKASQYARCFVNDIPPGMVGIGPDNVELGQDEVFRTVRRLARANWFVRAILKLRLNFYHYGFQVKAADKADAAEVEAWREQQAVALDRYLRDVWNERFVTTNVISFWRTGGGAPLVLNPDAIRYTDFFGEEVLTLNHGLNSEQLKKLPLTPEQRVRLQQSPTLELRHDDPDFFFDVWKDSKLATGLAWPDLYSVYLALLESESLEVGDSLLAAVSRRVWEHHKMGHEIKSGQFAGYKTHFASAERINGFFNANKAKTGHVQIGTNFDHTIEWPRPDPKYFDGRKWDGVVARLIWWSTPLGQMVAMKGGVSPYLMDMLKTQAQMERMAFAAHIEPVLREAFAAPAAVRLVWSNRCFKDTRVAADLLKAGLSSGPLSQETFIEEYGGDVDLERQRKAREAKLPKEQTYPLYDPAHGNDPQAETGGRPTGSTDPAGATSGK